MVSGKIGEPNVNRNGSDYKHSAVTSPRACMAQCYSDQSCLAWTFVRSKGECYLKNTVPKPVVDNCCTSGYFNVETIR
jgi:hypothetical protein